MNLSTVTKTLFSTLMIVAFLATPFSTSALIPPANEPFEYDDDIQEFTNNILQGQSGGEYISSILKSEFQIDNCQRTGTLLDKASGLAISAGIEKGADLLGGALFGGEDGEGYTGKGLDGLFDAIGDSDFLGSLGEAVPIAGPFIGSFIDGFFGGGEADVEENRGTNMQHVIDLDVREKERCLDSLVREAARMTMTKLNQSSLTWIQQGFENGNPGFVTDLASRTSDAAIREYNKFVTGDPAVTEVCPAWRNQVYRGVVTDFYAENPDAFGVGDIGSPSFDSNVTCGLDALTGGTDESLAFSRGDLTKGGWNAWDAFLVDNPTDSYLRASTELSRKTAEAEEQERQEFVAYGGFIADKRCPVGSEREGQAPAEDGFCGVDDQGRFIEPVVSTPGSVVGSIMQRLATNDVDRINLTDEFNEVLEDVSVMFISEVMRNGVGNATAPRWAAPTIGAVEPVDVCESATSATAEAVYGHLQRFAQEGGEWGTWANIDLRSGLQTLDLQGPVVEEIMRDVERLGPELSVLAIKDILQRHAPICNEEEAGGGDDGDGNENEPGEPSVRMEWCFSFDRKSTTIAGCDQSEFHCENHDHNGGEECSPGYIYDGEYCYTDVDGNRQCRTGWDQCRIDGRGAACIFTEGTGTPDIEWCGINEAHGATCYTPRYGETNDPALERCEERYGEDQCEAYWGQYCYLNSDGDEECESNWEQCVEETLDVDACYWGGN